MAGSRSQIVVQSLMSGAVAFGVIVLAAPVETGCGIIAMCPSNHAYKRQLDREFFEKASKCESGDDSSCSSIDADAKKKVQMCKDCSGCDGKENYEEVAADAKSKNRCNKHSEALSCRALAAKIDAQAKARGEYSDEAVTYYEKACSYGMAPSANTPRDCHRAKGPTWQRLARRASVLAVATWRRQCRVGARTAA